MSNIITNNSGVTHDVTEVVPVVGMTGLFSLNAPYSALIHSAVEYTCIAVSSIAGAVANGDDPLTDIYLANDDTEANYLVDEAANHCLVTLQSGMGDTVTVPNSALLALPKADGVRYANVILGVSLSAIPDDLDLATIKAEVADLIFHKLGVRSTVFSTTVGGTTIITHVQHAAVEAARLANITSHLSVKTQNAALQTQNAAMAAKIVVLEDYIKLNIPP